MNLPKARNLCVFGLSCRYKPGTLRPSDQLILLLAAKEQVEPQVLEWNKVHPPVSCRLKLPIFILFLPPLLRGRYCG
jgi:hypothetical protein